MVAYLIGVIVACLTGGTFASYLPSLAPYVFFVGPINGIAVSFIVYAILGKVAIKNHSIRVSLKGSIENCEKSVFKRN